MSQPLITFNVAYPGPQLEPSLLDVTVTSGFVLNPGTLYDGWCLDPYISIDTPGSYSAYVYSSNDLTALSAGMPTLGSPDGFLGNLDSINWLLNWYTGTNPGISYQEVQATIWKLMGEDWTQFGGFLGLVDVADIDSMYNNALLNDGYVPSAGEKMAVVLDVFNASGVHLQPIIIETVAASIGDRVWVDDNANGVQDGGEAGKAGVTVELYTCVNNAPGTLVATTTTADGTGTNPIGYYNFAGLMPGDYIVKFIAADGSVLSTANIGNDALDSDAGVGGYTACYSLTAGENETSVDAGFYKKASLGDYVWHDANNNGQQDDGVASGLNGVTVNLRTAAGALVSSTVTANDSSGNPGYYLFSNLIPGDYKVEFVKPAGYAFAQKDVGADGSDSDADTLTGMTIPTTLTSGENDLSWDAGLVQLARLGDRIWEDSNANGQQDAGEAGIAGVTVQLKDAGGNVIATTTTDGNGLYGFDVVPGT